jgi:DNA-binding Lrp family transcriptional regulator
VSEEQVKEVIERIGYQEFYRYYEDKDVLIRLQKEEIERLNNIIKEVRKLLESKKHCERLFGGVEGKSFTEQALEILDKADKENI